MRAANNRSSCWIRGASNTQLSKNYAPLLKGGESKRPSHASEHNHAPSPHRGKPGRKNRSSAHIHHITPRPATTQSPQRALGRGRRNQLTHLRAGAPGKMRSCVQTCHPHALSLEGAQNGVLDDAPSETNSLLSKQIGRIKMQVTYDHLRHLTESRSENGRYSSSKKA